MDLDDLWTIGELTDLLNISRARIYQLHDELGFLPAKIAGRLFYTQEQVKTMMRRNTKPGRKKKSTST